MKSKPTNFPCTPAAEALIIGRHEYSGFGMYVKLLQIIYKLPDRCLRKDNVQHIISSNGMDTFTVEQLLENPSLFICDNERYFPVEAKSNPRKERIIENPPAEHDLQKYIKKFFPIISSMDQQLSVKNCESLIADYDKRLIMEKLKAMENCKGLTKKYVNVYLTLNNWCKLSMERGWSPPQTVKATAARV